MYRILTRLFVLLWISTLTACSSFSGNVVPNKGLTMEQVYDSGDSHESRELSAVPANAVSREFKKLPNPELSMYVYPHVAGKEQLPIPGYETVLSAYTEEHYVLPNEMIRDYAIELY